MKIFVNNQEMSLLPGMTVRHALISANLLDKVEAGEKAYDEWGNEISLDGALTEGSRIYLRARTCHDR